MNLLAIARTIHVLSIVHWIGGVFFVTFALLPGIRNNQQIKDKYHFFESLEESFALQARVSTSLAAITGFYMVYELDAWDRFLNFSEYWWMHAMVFTWLVFSIMLFILEPFFLHKILEKKAAQDPENTMQRIQRLHYILLAVSLITIYGVKMGLYS